jgi:glycosyltransferase involved in cell wall biosynthesis
MDLQVIRDAWIKIEREYGQRVVLEIVGGAQVSELEFGQPYGDYININYPGFVNWLRAQRRWHIGVIPLADTDFNRRKSYIKYLDYAALGVPIICSDIEPYREVARNGENSLIVRNTTEAWYQALKQLIDQDGLRDRLAQAAFNDLTKYYCLQQRAGEYFRAYQGVLED